MSTATIMRRVVPAVTEPYPAISSLPQSTEQLKGVTHTKPMRKMSDSTTFRRTVMLSLQIDGKGSDRTIRSVATSVAQYAN